MSIVPFNELLAVHKKSHPRPLALRGPVTKQVLMDRFLYMADSYDDTRMKICDLLAKCFRNGKQFKRLNDDVQKAIHKVADADFGFTMLLLYRLFEMLPDGFQINEDGSIST